MIEGQSDPLQCEDLQEINELIVADDQLINI